MKASRTWRLCFVGHNATNEVRLSSVQGLHEIGQLLLEHERLECIGWFLTQMHLTDKLVSSITGKMAIAHQTKVKI